MGGEADQFRLCDPSALREYLDTLDEAVCGAASEVQSKFKSHPDTAYGTATMLGWLVDHKIAPNIPVLNK